MADKRRHQPPDRPDIEGEFFESARWVVTLSEVEYWSEALRQCTEDLDFVRFKMRTEGRAVQPSQISAMHRACFKARQHLDQALAGVPDDMRGASHEEILNMVEANANSWPDQVIETVIKVYAERHNGRILLISEGGRRAELDERGQWQPMEA